MTSNQSPSSKPHLSEEWIDSDALDIVRQLQRKAYISYLVGGCVRDLLIGRQPKDYDISTNARPRDVKNAIRNSYIIGKRFRLVLAKRDERLFEISTFRREATPEELKDETLSTDNLFGSPEEDAKRRDFTINALFYDPTSKKVIDYVKGLSDLKEGVIRMIGDPLVRLEEDPIRIMRGIRLSHMIRFALEPSLRRGMQKLSHLLPGTALPRRREELLKFLRLDDPALAFITSHDLHVLEFVCPSIHHLMNDNEKAEEFIEALHHFSSLGLESPGDLFAGLTLLYAKAALGLNFEASERPEQLLDQKEINEFMRLELGMFNAEQDVFKKSISLIWQLRKRRDFERRGERRRWALFRNDSFELSLKFAEKFFLLSADDLAYWRKEYDARPKEAISNSQGRRRRRPRRRKKSSDPQTSADPNLNK